MGLRTIGNVDTQHFGTGDPEVIASEVMTEPRLVDVLVDAVSGDVVHITRGEHKVERTTKYGGATDLADTFDRSVTRRTVTKTNDDFVKITEEKETFS